MNLAKNIYNIGVNDENIRLFEGQYKLESGMSYNSYLIKDKKNVILDTVDKRVTSKWLEKLEYALNGEKVDYLVISHMEPDHGFNIKKLAQMFPDMKIIGNVNTFNMFNRFFSIDISNRKIVVKEGEEINIGEHTLKFFMAPMVHWPEVMVTYEQKEKILFSADAFGKFGIIKSNDTWLDEARRFYIGIVGKYGIQVQNLLKKASTLEIKKIYPLHGTILEENINYYINKYNVWSTYEPEEEGILIACSSIHGNTLEAAKYLEKELIKQEKKVELIDLTTQDFSEAVAMAFKFSKLIVASSSYNAGLFPPMVNFLHNLKERNYQKRKVAIIQNGSWAPSSGKIMEKMLHEMTDIDIIDHIITIESTFKEKNKKELKELAKIF